MRTIVDNAFLYTEDRPLQKIEKIARTCYKSEDKITHDSARKMVSALVKRKHEAMLEHYTYIIKCPEDQYRHFWVLASYLKDAGYEFMLRGTAINGRYIISGNVRIWRDFIRSAIDAKTSFPFIWIFGGIDEEFRTLFGDLDIKAISALFPRGERIYASDLSTEEKLVHFDITAGFVCDRGVSHEIVRHRKASFAQESTRYCNYSLGKFGAEIAVIEPPLQSNEAREVWLEAMQAAEAAYNKLIFLGETPQIARSVLANSLKTELFMTASAGEWRHFFKLRAIGVTGAPHPQMKSIAAELLLIFAEAYPDLFGDLKEELK